MLVCGDFVVKILSLSVKIIYGLIMLVAVQSVLSIDKFHIEADNHAVTTTQSIQYSTETFHQPIQTAVEIEHFHEPDCHQGHCHHANFVYLEINSSELILDLSNAKLSQALFSVNSLLVSPGLRPPIV
jgi:hypothetical protein